MSIYSRYGTCIGVWNDCDFTYDSMAWLDGMTGCTGDCDKNGIAIFSEIEHKNCVIFADNFIQCPFIMFHVLFSTMDSVLF